LLHIRVVSLKYVYFLKEARVLDGLNTVAPGQRYRIRSRAGAPVTGDPSEGSPVIHHLPRGIIVLCAETAPARDGRTRARISAPAGWLDAELLEPAGPAASLKLDFDVFEKKHLEVAPGDEYGLEFPFTIESLRDFGAAFLTKAFQAAGTISQDNAVAQVVELRRLGITGASENAFLTVAYAKPEPGLEAELFVKFPPADMHFKFGLARMSHGEVAMMRLSRSGILPVPVAKYYFGDYCSATSNYILITGRIAFGVAPIEPAYRKGRDDRVPEVSDHYRVLTGALAKLVAAQKTGALGYDLEQDFPFARAAREFHHIATPEINVDRLIDFISRVAPQLFPAETTTPGFLKRWREDLLFGLSHNDIVTAYLHKNIDYTGLCHPNLNIDNAWFWRDEAGELQVGLLDWGGAGQMSIAQALSGMLMMPDPDIYLALRRDVVDTFVKEYARLGGLKLDADELTLQYKASVFSTALGTIVGIIVPYLQRFSDDEYKTMKTRFDERLLQSEMVSAIIWIDNMLREWTDGTTPGDVCRRIVAEAG